MSVRPNFTAEQIDAAAPRLPKAHADILRAALSNGNYKALGLALGIGMGTVKSRLNRARASLAAVVNTPEAV